ncbi:MAG: SCO family protein [Actinomycetota bacterium]
MIRRRVAALAVVLVVALAACGDDGGPTELTGFERSPAPSVAELALPEVGADDDFDFRADDGELLVVYFGYTFCPDVCPTTLSDLRRALEDLGDDADRVSVAMATIDPGRDTPEVISGYLTSFIDDGHPLRTEDDARLRAVTDVFGADYAVEALADGDVEVAHTGSLYAVDDRGELVVTWPFGITVEDLGNDLGLLLDRSA